MCNTAFTSPHSAACLAQRKTAFTVGNITAERLSFAACTAQIVDCLFQLDAVRPTKIV